MTLGRLTRLDLRDIWSSEAQDFTPWLARGENLALLSDTLGLELELEAVEQNVGPFRADILCRDTLSDRFVLIENQLERTDHTHLGQLLTYAAGLDAVTIIWIAAKVTDEHRAALDWLNEITATEIRFFALEIELWRIADSPVAPKFNVVSQPNDWSRQASVGRQADPGLSALKTQYLRYWEQFSMRLGASGSGVRPVAPRGQHWLDHSIGRSGFLLRLSLNSQENWIRAELYLNGLVAAAFPRLLAQRDALEAAFGAPLDWQELPGRKASRICTVLAEADPTDEADWSRQHDWLLRMITGLHQCFQDPVRNLPRDLLDEEDPSE